MRHLIVALTLLLAVPASAQEDLSALEAFVPRINDARACWATAFGQSYLAEHPRQQVTSMRFGIQFAAEPATVEHPPGPPLWNFELGVTLRGSDAEHVAQGNCYTNASGTIACLVECDGGGVDVGKLANGDVSVDLTDTGFIRLLACGGDSTGAMLLTSTVANSYQLQSVAPASCARIIAPGGDAEVE
ncbi:MAG: hypothetical protein JWR75_1874 [Devosia sp.]|nr:hypothetical protein [Devosia sp.]